MNYSLDKEKLRRTARTGMRLTLMPPLLLAAAACGTAPSVEEYCVIDEISKVGSDVNSNTHTLLVEEPDTGKRHRIMSIGVYSIHVNNQVNAGDELTLKISVQTNPLTSLMSPAAARAYSEKRQGEISQTETLTLTDPNIGQSSESVTITDLERGGCLPQAHSRGR